MSRFLTNQKPWIEDLIFSSLTFEPETTSTSTAAPEPSHRNNNLGTSTSTSASTSTRGRDTGRRNDLANTNSRNPRRRCYVTRTAQLVRGPEYIPIVPTPTSSTNNGNGNTNTNTNNCNDRNKAIRFIITDGSDTIPLIIPWSEKRHLVHAKFMDLLEPPRGTGPGAARGRRPVPGDDSIRRVLRPGCMITVRYYSVGVTSFVRLPPYFPSHDNNSNTNRHRSRNNRNAGIYSSANTNTNINTAARIIRPPICSLCLVIESDPFVIDQWNKEDEGNDQLANNGSSSTNNNSSSSNNTSTSNSRPFPSILPFASRSTSISNAQSRNYNLNNINIHNNGKNDDEDNINNNTKYSIIRNNVRHCIENIGCEGCGVIGSLRDIHDNLYIRQVLQLLQNDPLRIQEQIIRSHSFQLFNTGNGSGDGDSDSDGFRKRKIPGSMTTFCSLNKDENIQTESSNGDSNNNANANATENYNEQIHGLVLQMDK